MRSTLLSIILLFVSTLTFSQQAKNGNYTVTAAGTVLNAYTSVTANVAANATSIQVANNTLINGPVLTTALAAGDLILIIQMQGADMDIRTDPIFWPGNYTLSNSAMGDLANMDNYRPDWGTVTNYNNAGKYEYAEGWRRREHWGFCGPDDDPLAAALLGRCAMRGPAPR